MNVSESQLFLIDDDGDNNDDRDGGDINDVGLSKKWMKGLSMKIDSRADLKFGLTGVPAFSWNSHSPLKPAFGQHGRVYYGVP